MLLPVISTPLYPCCIMHVTVKVRVSDTMQKRDTPLFKTLQRDWATVVLCKYFYCWENCQISSGNAYRIAHHRKLLWNRKQVDAVMVMTAHIAAEHRSFNHIR